MNIFDWFRKMKTADQTQSDSAENMNTNTIPETKPRNNVIRGRLSNVCENCGNPVDCYSKINPACHLLGKRLCLHCFKKLRKTTTVVCRQCSKTIPYLEMKNHLCADCWIKQLSELRDFYDEYHTRLSNALSEKGISVSPVSTEYVDASGRAMFPIIPSSTDCIPLRKDVHGNYSGDECAVFTIKVRDAVFALPDNGIGIRYLKASLDKDFMNKVHSLTTSRYIIALASNGNDLFALDDKGWILSTKQDWEKYQLYNILDEVRRITHDYFDASEISAAVSLYEQGIKKSITDKITYDHEQKAFIEYYDCGNSHEGVERVYSEIDRQDVLRHLTRYRCNLSDCHYGQHFLCI